MLWFLVLAPVLFGLIGFAFDLGLMYSSKAELKTAASSMALAAGQQLLGTDASGTNATTAALQTVETLSGTGNKYYFDNLLVGQSTGNLSSTISDPAFYADAADAIASAAAPGSGVTPAQAKYVRITVTGDTPLFFWDLVPGIADHKISVIATAVAGMSAPLCIACGIEPIVVAAVNSADTTDFGLTPGTEYAFAYSCTPGATGPAPVLPPGTATLGYALADRLNPNAVIFPDETSQAYREGAGGLPGSTDQTQACFNLNVSESIWPGATPKTCGTALEVAVSSMLCGMDARMESTPPSSCSTVTSIDQLATAYQSDTDVTPTDTYTDYAGNGRRIITIPIVNSIVATGMTVLGFRQFLLEPNSSTPLLNPSDIYGRFVAMYIGSVAPIPQGRFDTCTQAAGPGKVVLHQ